MTHEPLVDQAAAEAEMQELMAAKQAEIDVLKAERDALLAAQEGTPCKHKFNAVLGGVLSCIHCYASFSEQGSNHKGAGDL